jgi:hypothetical protein
MDNAAHLQTVQEPSASGTSAADFDFTSYVLQKLSNGVWLGCGDRFSHERRAIGYTRAEVTCWFYPACATLWQTNAIAAR